MRPRRAASGGAFRSVVELMLRRKITKARSFGFLRLVRCQLARAWLRIVRAGFAFDRWHADAPFACRRYKRTVIDLVNGLRPSSVVEIGCGLGDIIARVDAQGRTGYDIDARVIRAARFLHPRGPDFMIGEAASVKQSDIDVVVMVNWIHNVSPQDLERLVVALADRARYLVLDAVDADAPASYRYKHTFDFLAETADRVSITRAPDEQRSFHVFRVRRRATGSATSRHRTS